MKENLSYMNEKKKNIMLREILCIAIVATFFCYSTSMGETIINGPLTESQVWTVDGSPYIIEGEVRANNNGISLEIEPGTTVLFNTGASLFFEDGSFIAQGTEESPILFSSSSSSPMPGDYLGLFLVTGGNVTMSHCVIEYANTGLSLAKSLAAESVEIRNCYYGLHLFCLHLSSTDVSGFYIHNNTSFGIHCDTNLITIRDCIISANGSTGIYAYYNVWIDHCTIQENGGDGISFSGVVSNCNISGNGGHGLVLDGSSSGPATAHQNTITGNSGYGVWVYYFVANPNEPQINWCSVYDNGDYDLAVDNSCLYPTVDATHNFWNTQDAEIISERILDSNDDSTLTSEVIFMPFEGSVATERKTFGEIKCLFR